MLNEKMIAALEAKGFNRWTKETTKGTMDRLYIDATKLGLELDYYKTGNIKWAAFNGETISNSRGYGYKNAKTYIDVATGKVYSDKADLKEAAQALLDEAEAELEAEAEGKVTNEYGVAIDFESAVNLMDDEIREAIHAAGVDTDQAFFDAYVKAHAEKFGEEWELSKPNPIY